MKYVALLAALLLAGCTNPYKKKSPDAKNGVIDLTQWDFSADGNVKLDGDWEFYWQKLYGPADFKAGKALPMTGYIPVRSSWNEVKVNGHVFPSFGYATYRLKVCCSHTHGQLGLKLLDMGSAYNLWVNGSLVSSNGKVSSNPDSMVPQNLPGVRVLDNTGDTLDVVVQVANNFHYKAGIWESILLGPSGKIIQIREDGLIYATFIAGASGILAILFFMLFILRKKEEAALIFSFICAVFLVRTIITGERLLYLMFPSFNLQAGYRLEYVALVVITLLVAMFVRKLFTRDASKIFTFFILAGFILFTVIILVTPAIFYTHQLIYMQIYFVVSGGYAVLITLKSVIKKRPFSGHFLFSFTILFAAVVNDILYSQLIINTGYYVAYAFSFFLLVQAYILSFRTTLAIKNVEDLSETLNETNVQLEEANENLEQANINLENKVVERTHQLEEEKQKSEDLLLNILPEETATELKKYGFSKARHYEFVTVMFTDFKDFTLRSEELGPEQLVAELDACFSAFDKIITRYGIEKIKTIGDAYLAASGMPAPDPCHAANMLNAAVEIREWMLHRRHQKGNATFEVRIGIHSGPLVAGIVGEKKFAYDIWGDTVNTAARMEQNSEAGKINISQATYALIKEEFDCGYRGEIEAKNKGRMGMYFVN